MRSFFFAGKADEKLFFFLFFLFVCSLTGGNTCRLRLIDWAKQQCKGIQLYRVTLNESGGVIIFVGGEVLVVVFVVLVLVLVVLGVVLVIVEVVASHYCY